MQFIKGQVATEAPIRDFRVRVVDRSWGSPSHGPPRRLPNPIQQGHHHHSDWLPTNTPYQPSPIASSKMGGHADDDSYVMPRSKHLVPPPPHLAETPTTDPSLFPTEATREEMREARLPLAYRDSCASLLIPLNRCRFDTYYLPWKCEVRRATTPPRPLEPASEENKQRGANIFFPRAGRETLIREMPICRVQEAGGQDERAQGGQGRQEEQLDERRGGRGNVESTHAVRRQEQIKPKKDQKIDDQVIPIQQESE